MIKALKSFDRLTPSTRQRIEEALQQRVEEVEGVDPMPPIGRPAPPKEKRVASSKVAPEGEGGEGGDEEGGGKTSAEPVDPASEKELVVEELEVEQLVVIALLTREKRDLQTLVAVEVV